MEFRTKRGRCVIDDESLRLESSFVGYLKRLKEGNLLIFGSVLLASIFVVGAFVLGDLRKFLVGVGIGVSIVVVSYAVNRLRGFTSDDKIDLDAIRRVKAVEGTKGLTRPRFVIEYEKGDKTKKRYVMMPSKWLSYGDDEFEKAKETFQELGVLAESETGTAKA
ncbi:MAG: hypothetical protein SXQ77_03110 [Halobacteria archaeon]|nr:hypothetical protein [Halobacteria archaeon]